MIKVTVELWPFGVEKGKVHLGTAYIANDISGSISLGNYNCVFTKKDHSKWKKCRVERFPRKRLLGWDLLYRALKEIVGGRND